MSGLIKLLMVIRTLFVKNAKFSQVENSKKPTKETMTSKTKGIIYFKNSTKRLQDEFIELMDRNKLLHELIVDTCAFCKAEFNKDITITMIYRTDAEQDEIYKNDEKYKQKKFKSPHQFFHAVDLRSSTFDTSEIEKLVNYLNLIYNKTNYYNWTAKCHDVGVGEHFHIQFVKK